WFGVYDSPHRLDADAVTRALAGAGAATVEGGRFSLARAAYAEQLAQIRHHIREGDVYQINFTAPCHVEVTGDPLGLYRALRQRQPVPFGAWLHLDDAERGRRQILSL